MKAASLGLLLAAPLALAACVHAEQRTTAIGQRVDETKLGAPIYPGAQADERGAVAATSRAGNGVTAGFKTSDAFEKVETFYRERLPRGAETMSENGENGSVASFRLDEKDTALVVVQVTAWKPGETDVIITHLRKRGG